MLIIITTFHFISKQAHHLHDNGNYDVALFVTFYCKEEKKSERVRKYKIKANQSCKNDIIIWKIYLT